MLRSADKLLLSHVVSIADQSF